MRDKFLNNSDYLDKQHLERSALTASQLKRRVDQSRENLKIVQKRQLSTDTSPLHKQQLTSDRDRERAKALKELLEANARWDNERRDAAKNDIRRLVDETGLLNPDLRKEMIYSWKKGFIEDKVEDQSKSPPKTILRKDPWTSTHRLNYQDVYRLYLSEVGYCTIENSFNTGKSAECE